MPFKYTSSTHKALDYSNLQEINNDTEFLNKLHNLPEKINKADIDNLLKNISISRYKSSINTLIDYLSKRKNNQIDSIKDVVKVLSLFNNDLAWWEERKDVFSESFLDTLKKEVLDTKYSTKNSLNRYFSTTRGFNIFFKPAYKDKVIEYFPFFKEYIDAVFADDIDMFFMNALILTANSNVGKHVDLTLGTYDRNNISPPARVAVLYVDVPDMIGGDLVLYNQRNVFATITPQKNKLVYFKGNLGHEVTSVTKMNESDKKFRVSLVCELYKIRKEVLKNIPNFKTDVPRSVWYTKTRNTSLQY